MLDENIRKDLIQKGRNFMKGYRSDDPYIELDESDQTRKLPQPPLVKAPMRGENAKIALPRDFSDLAITGDLTDIIFRRHSSRVYTQETMPLVQLSYLLWATQGVKGKRGKAYATLRTVPCGGARHEFETYLMVRNVEGLQPGAYHYLPMEHALEYLHPVEDMDAKIGESLRGQDWAAKANVVFYWAMVAYRAEWRYSIYTHRVALIDAGHIGQNLYIAATGLGLGTCGIAAFSHELCCELFELDGEEEYMVYTAPVGTVKASDRAAEDDFYRFVKEQDL